MIIIRTIYFTKHRGCQLLVSINQANLLLRGVFLQHHAKVKYIYTLLLDNLCIKKFCVRCVVDANVQLTETGNDLPVEKR